MHLEYNGIECFNVNDTRYTGKFFILNKVVILNIMHSKYLFFYQLDF